MCGYVIETHNLSKNFKNQIAVNNVNIKIKQGTIYGLLGKNGAGKTTLMCMLLDLVKKTNGESYIFGYDTTKDGKYIYPKVGSIIETPGFYTNLTGFENLKLFSKLNNSCSNERIGSVLKLVSLYDDKDKVFKNYSLGMKQRLGIALALLKDPELLILDEPINGLDPVGIIEIRNLLKKLSQEYGITILISSHILSEMEHIVDVIGIMDNGKLIKEITIEDLHNTINRHVHFEVSNTNKAKFVLDELGLLEGIDYECGKNNILLINHIESSYIFNKEFVENGIDVFGQNLVEDNLEEYFMELIGGY